MKRSPSVWTVIPLLTLFYSGAVLSTDTASDVSFVPAPRVDERGFIDVWQLRKDVIAVEALQAYEDYDWCYTEGDPDVVLSSEEFEVESREAEKCVEEVERAFAVYTRVRKAFNDAWLPAIYAAIEKGDKLAEVIMRQCDTTPVLVRDGIESTCRYATPEQRGNANERLREIGFIPAVDLGDEIVNDRGNSMAQRGMNQVAVLSKVRAGALGHDRSLVSMGGNVAKNQTGVDNYRRWELMEAIFQDAPRAFTFSPGHAEAGWQTSAFTNLRLNRRPLTPGYLTQGQRLHYGGGNSIYTGPRYWRLGSFKFYRSAEKISGRMGGPKDHTFLQQREELLAEIESNIDAYLSEDPRWGVFLLHRVGHHEWVPEGMTSDTDLINDAWLGNWQLDKVFLDWIPVDEPAEATTASIGRNGSSTVISFQSRTPPSSPIGDARNCQLRYSGGLSYLPSHIEKYSLSHETVLGYLKTYPIEGLADVLEPFDPTKRYKQVLVLCPEGESLDSSRTRYLLLAEDTMVEVATDTYAIGYVRHFTRVSDPDASTERAGSPGIE